MPNTVLIADDDPVFRAWARALVSRAGFQTLEAADGEEALQVAGSGNPDLILLDAALPVYLGTEVCEKLRQNPDTSNIPIVFITAWGRDLSELHIDSDDLRAEGFLQKPASAEALLHVVRRWASVGQADHVQEGAEKRRLPRAPIDVEGKLAPWPPSRPVEKPYPPSRVVSISEAGAFVLTPQPLPEGTQFQLELLVPGESTAVRAQAQVAYCRAGLDAGMGVYFLNLTPDEQAQIRAYVDLIRRFVR